VPEKKNRTSVPEEKLRLYERLIATLEGVDTKANFGAAYTAVNGNMYSMISKHGVVGIRLPKDQLAAFLAKYNTELFRGDPAWPPAKEFAAVPDDLLTRTEVLKPYMRASYEYVLTLKPKPPARKKGDA